MPSEIRIQRISDRIRQDISEMLVMGEIHDPRLTGIMVSDATVDRELAYADVYVSAIEGQQREKEVMAGLESATGYIRRRLAKTIQLRVFPRLRFHWDVTPERAEHIEKLLADLKPKPEPKRRVKKS
jgi:ribosome-binding factor A